MASKKSITSVIVKIILFYVIDEMLGMGIHVLSSIATGEHGSPSFLTTGFIIYGVITKVCLITAFLILGNKIPIKNRILKGLCFTFFFWATDYLPQILGMLGAYSPIVDPKALTFHTILIDSIGYIKTGILMGLFLATENCYDKRTCAAKAYIIGIVVSFITFPILLFILEMIIAFFAPSCTCIQAFGIKAEDTVRFYLVFYAFQAVSGIMFPIFYRCTEFNDSNTQRGTIFAHVHNVLLWTPIVCIMPFFGVAITPTLVFAAIMLIVLYVDTTLFAKIITK